MRRHQTCELSKVTVYMRVSAYCAFFRAELLLMNARRLPETLNIRDLVPNICHFTAWSWAKIVGQAV